MQKNLKKILSTVLMLVMLLSLCAPVFSISAAEELTTIKKWNLVLGDEIAANFYVNVSDAVSDSAVMHVTDGYGTQQYDLTAAKKDDNGNYLAVRPQEGVDYTLEANTDGWFKYNEVWYCKTPIAVGFNTPQLIKKFEATGKNIPEGYHLSIQFLADAIQSQPDQAVKDAWGVNVVEGILSTP